MRRRHAVIDRPNACLQLEGSADPHATAQFACTQNQRTTVHVDYQTRTIDRHTLWCDVEHPRAMGIAFNNVDGQFRRGSKDQVTHGKFSLGNMGVPARYVVKRRVGPRQIEQRQSQGRLGSHAQMSGHRDIPGRQMRDRWG